MIAIVAALLLAAGADQARFPGVLGQGGSIKLPPPIDEQVRPYRACLLGQFERNPRLRTGGAEAMRAANAEAIAACAEARRTAAAQSDAALRSNRAYRNEAKRRSSIEKVLADLDSGLLPLYLAMAPPPQPRPQSGLTDEQATIVYDQCLAYAAQRASKTDAADTAIFGIARADCAGQRAELLRGAGAERAGIFDSIDSNRPARFPEATRKVREMRRAFEAQAGTAKRSFRCSFCCRRGRTPPTPTCAKNICPTGNAWWSRDGRLRVWARRTRRLSTRQGASAWPRTSDPDLRPCSR